MWTQQCTDYCIVLVTIGYHLPHHYVQIVPHKIGFTYIVIRISFGCRFGLLCRNSAATAFDTASDYARIVTESRDCQRDDCNYSSGRGELRFSITVCVLANVHLEISIYWKVIAINFFIRWHSRKKHNYHFVYLCKNTDKQKPVGLLSSYFKMKRLRYRKKHRKHRSQEQY